MQETSKRTKYVYFYYEYVYNDIDSIQIYICVFRSRMIKLICFFICSCRCVAIGQGSRDRNCWFISFAFTFKLLCLHIFTIPPPYLDSFSIYKFCHSLSWFADTYKHRSIQRPIYPQVGQITDMPHNFVMWCCVPMTPKNHGGCHPF